MGQPFSLNIGHQGTFRGTSMPEARLTRVNRVKPQNLDIELRRPRSGAVGPERRLLMDKFTATAKEKAAAFAKASDSRDKADRTMCEIWLTLAAVRDPQRTADDHYRALPVQYRDRLTSESFTTIWSVARKCSTAIRERNLEVADVVKECGSLNKVKAFLFPKKEETAVSSVSGGKKADAKAQAGVAESERVDVVVTTSKEASLDALLEAAEALPSDKLAILHERIGRLLAARSKKAASKKAA